MSKPWTMETFPINETVWIRHKGMPSGASMITNLAYEGVSVHICENGDGKANVRSFSWLELHATCERITSIDPLVVAPCGVN